MSQDIKPTALPASMDDKLRAIRRRQTALILARAVVVGASVLISAMVFAMAADWWFTLFNTSVRTVLTTASIGAMVLACLAAGVRPLMAVLGWKHAAASADNEVPELEERWSTVASFAESAHRPATDEGRAMLEQVTSEAVALARLVKPQRVARPRSLKPAALALAACLVVLSGFLALDWPRTSVLLRRFWSPTAQITATKLNNITGDVTVPRGELLQLTTEQSGLITQSALLTLEYDAGTHDVFELPPDQDSDLLFTHIMRADDSFRYRVRAGDDRTEWRTVTVIDYPALAEVQFTVTPPDYVDRPPFKKTLIPGRVRAVQGSRLNLAMKPQSALERLDLQLTFPREGAEATLQTQTLEPDADGWYRFQSQLLEDVVLRPQLVSTHGLTNLDHSDCRIQVIPDRAPVARVISPTAEMSVAVDETIDIQFEAHDDHGIATAELVVYDESLTDAGVEPRLLAVQPIPLGEQRLERHVLASTQLDLTKLNLEKGMNISYAVRVTDNRQVTVTPDAMTAQRSEARPEESNDSSPPPADPSAPLAHALADARDLTGRQADEGPAGEPDRTRSPTGRNPTPSPDGTDPTADSDSESQASNKRIRNSDEQARGNDRADDSVRQSEPNVGPSSGVPTRDERTPSTEDSPRAASATRETPDEERSSGDETPPSNDPPKDSPAPAADDSETAGESDDEGESQPNRDRPSEDGPTDEADTTLAQSGIRESEADPDDENAPAASATATDPSDEEPQANNAESRANRTDEASVGDPDSASDRPESEPRPPMPFVLDSQQAQGGQNTETSRRTLKITERLTALAAADELAGAEKMEIRDQVVAIDRMLIRVESGLQQLVDREIPDAARSTQFADLDEELGHVEIYIAELREETKDEQFAFVGLQMVDIGRTHITPARDRVFAAIRDTAGDDSHANHALQHIVRARELLAALLKQYDSVVRERELAGDLDQTITMYEVYVEKMQQLMREARQNRNPLERKMGIIEVDQDYLDRYAEVLTLRREMLAEFAHMLADDPRLLAKYMDLIKRRRTSLRDQLTVLAERQYDASTEVSGWLLANDDQQRDLWMLVTEMRLHASTTLARDAAELAERIDKQMPLVLDPEAGTPTHVLEHARNIASLAREIAFDAEEVIQSAGVLSADSTLLANSERLVWTFSELGAALDQLDFESRQEEEVTEYVSARLLESRTVADQANAWLRLARDIEEQRYSGLAEVDQKQIALSTELLRVEMLDMEGELEGEFQQQLETAVPGEIIDMIRELHGAMERITFHQQAATFALSRGQLEPAELQQAAALDRFDQAEELFDRIRRAVVDALDESDPPDPNIADLEDPTLDEFLARLEREPNVEALLGIPNRPRNLRLVADSLLWQQEGGEGLGESMDAAIARAQKAMRRQPGGGNKEDEQPKQTRPLTDEERERQMAAREMQEMIDRSLAAMHEKIDDPMTSQEERRRLQQMADNLKQMQGETGQANDDPRDWERLAQSDEAKETLRALALGQPIPDQQWNRLMSTLEDGLWQVDGRTPPEDYREAIEEYQERIRRLVDSFGVDDQ